MMRRIGAKHAGHGLRVFITRMAQRPNAHAGFPEDAHRQISGHARIVIADAVDMRVAAPHAAGQFDLRYVILE